MTLVHPQSAHPVPAERPGRQRLSEVQEFIAANYGLVAPPTEIDLNLALGRILATDLIAAADLPRFDCAAMDGFAVRSADLLGEEPTALRIVGRATAGHPSEARLDGAETIRIFTGAALPAGADRVLMQEDCRVEGDRMFPLQTGRKTNVRRRGEDVTVGSIAIRQGAYLGGAELSLAAALHCRTLPVYRRLKVALFSTGDELRGPEEPIGPGQIADANRPMLRALIGALGCEVQDGGILRDDLDTQLTALIDAARHNDLIVTSGGASVGDEDHLTRAIRKRGYLEAWRLKIKPGKPVGLGDIDDCPILALPGNPVAAALTFLMVGRPLVARLGGMRELLPRSIRLPVASEMSKRPGRWEAHLGQFLTSEGITTVAPIAGANSATLGALVRADGFITLPEAIDRVAAGTLVDFVPLSLP